MNIFIIFYFFLIYNVDIINDNINLLRLSYSDKTIFIVGSTFLHFFVYWFLGLFYLIIDMYKINYFKKYKIQSTIYPYNKKLLYNTIKVVLINQIIINPIIAYFVYNFNSGILDIILPSTINIIFDLIISLFIVEITFYYIHRLLHLPFLYKYIHSIHHIYSTPIAIGALYAHPLEYIFSNILPVVLGPLLCKSHFITLLLFQFMAVVNTVSVHSGYIFPFMINPSGHDIHHMKYKYNFGVIDILDKFHGTYLEKM